LTELRDSCGDARRTQNERVHFSAARFVSQHARRGHCFEADFSQLGAAGFDKCEDTRHQKTFA
jgi:hypothetical protein